MRKSQPAILSALLIAGCLFGLSPATAKDAPVSFQEDVLPIFQVHCASCHHAPDGEGFKASGLQLTDYAGVMTGTKYGPMIIAGQPDNSNLMWLLDWRASPQLRMPHGKKQLPVGERETIRTWIRQGAKNN